MKNNKTLSYILIIVGAAILLAVGLSFLNAGEGSRKYDEVASCMAEKGVKFYGAFWCPHCAEQKRAFGASSDKLPYIECSTPDAAGQTQVCTDAKIESYPTWEFADGSRVSQVMTPERLAELSGCMAALPGNASSTAPVQTGTSTAQ